MSVAGALTHMIALPPERTLDQSRHFACSAVDSFVQSRRVVSDHYRLLTLEAGFDHAALIVRAALLSVLVAEVDFHTGDPIAESIQGTLDHTCEPCGQRLMPFDVIGGIDLNSHGFLNCLWPWDVA
jgi:hypothetical protein